MRIDPTPCARRAQAIFKWICLTTAATFLGALAWLVNDMRLQVRQTSQAALAATQIVNEHLPEIVENVRKTAETLAELSEDLRQLKELAGVTGSARDKSLVAYADEVLDAVEASGGTVGLKKVLGGSGLKSALPAKEWVVGARKEALFLTMFAKSKKELLERLSANKFGSAWHIQVGGEPVPLLEWLRANPAASRDAGAGRVDAP